MATIQDVAKAAGVSVSTVSRALNNYGDVNENTREKVREVARELGYIANINARSLSSKRQVNIALILSGFLEEAIINDVETMLLKGAYFYAMSQGIEISMHVIDSRVQEEREYEQLCHEYGIAGAIVFGLKTTDRFHRTLPGTTVPCVTIDTDLTGPKLANVTVDDVEAFRMLTQYLIDCGHRKIVLVQGRRYALVSDKRLAGAEAAMKENGLSFTEDQMIYADFLEDKAYEGVLEYFRNHNPEDATAFLCMSDLMSFGVLKALRHLGYRVPEDYSVAGYDGQQATSYTYPALTTVDQNFQSKGYMAAKLLHQLIKGEKIEHNTMLPYTLIERDSVKKLAE